MSNLDDFRDSLILRHPTTWIVAAIAGIYGGLRTYGIREMKRAEGAEVQLPWLWLERSVEFLFGAAIQVIFLLCAVWMVAGLMEKWNTWLRQGIVVAVFLAINWLTQIM